MIDIPKEAIDRYIERREKDIELCEQALATSDFEVISRVGHQIKGNAVTFGFQELEPVGIELEKAGNKKDAQGTADLIGKLRAFVASQKGSHLI